MERSSLTRVILVLALCAWMLTTVALLARPVASLTSVTGLYDPETLHGQTFRWSGDRVVIPLARSTGPTTLTLRLSAMCWPGRSAPELALRDDAGTLARFTAPMYPRTYRFTLQPGTTAVTIDSTVDRPPDRDPRWLGFVLYDLKAQAEGLPIGRLGLSLALLPVFLAVAAGLIWAFRCGYGVPYLLFGAALALRAIQIDHTPPGWRVDEVISLVDAWHLSRTGRDHLGHVLPLGAFEALGDWISPLLTYLELPFVAVVGPQRMVGRLVTASVGALAAPLGYALAHMLGLGRAGAIAAGLAFAISPWQVFISRTAIPPALVPTCWTLCLLAGVRFIKDGDRRSALGLALAAGVALYAYPTLKLAVPLLTALAVGLALFGPGGAHRAIPPRTLLAAGLLLALLWTPFVWVTLFNPASSTRLHQAALRADTWSAWLSAWWAGYSVYFTPDFYYRNGDGSSTSGMPGFGVELWGSLPLVLLGLAGTVVSLVGPRRGLSLMQPSTAWFILGAVAIAALPASLTTPSPHAFRAATLAPLYALLVGCGVAVLAPSRPRASDKGWQRRLRWPIIGMLGVAILWQGAEWWKAYTQYYPDLQAGLNHDGLAEAVQRAVELAPRYDEVWVSADSIAMPYVYVLAAQPFPPAEAQRLLVVRRQPRRFNHVISLGPYRFVETNDLPIDLPAVAAVPGRAGGKGYVVQEWHHAEKRILILRAM